MSDPSLIGPHEDGCSCKRCKTWHLGSYAQPSDKWRTAFCGVVEDVTTIVMGIRFYDPRASNCDACKRLCGETEEQLRATDARVENNWHKC